MAATDASLLQRWVETQDADAFAEIVARHAGMVYGTCMRILGNAADGEDVAQECFLDLANSAGRVRQCLGGWLHAAAVHRSLNRLQADRRRQHRERRYAASSATTVVVDWNDLREHVDAAIAELPKRLREPIILRFLEGETLEAIAHRLGMPKSTARFRIDRGIVAIRRTLERRRVFAGPAAGFAALLAANTAEAAPASLTAKLGSLALAGVAPSAGLAANVGVLLMKKVYVGAASVLALALLAWLTLPELLDGRAGGRPEVSTPVVEDLAASTLHESASPAPGTPPNAAGEKDAAKAAAETLSPATDNTGPMPASAEKEGAISGRVLTEDGYAFAGATVHVRITADALGFEPSIDRETETDPDGLYRIARLDEPGTAWVYATARGYATQKSRPLRMAPGTALAGVDFTLPKARYTIAGEVVSEPGRQPVPGAVVQLRHCGYAENQSWGGRNTSVADLSAAFADDKGRFELAVDQEGLCDLVVTKNGFGPGYFGGIRTGTRDARLVLKAPGGVSGKVTTRSGEAVPEVRIRATAKGWPLGTSETDTTAFAPTQLPAVEAETGPDGAYEITGLGSGFDYVVQAAAVGPAHPAQADFSRGDDIAAMLASLVTTPGLAPVQRVDIRPGETVRHVDFVLEPVSTVRGRVTDPASGRPVYPFCVTAMDDASSDIAAADAMLKGLAATAPDGSYEMQFAHARNLRLKFGGLYTFNGGACSSEQDPPPVVVELRPGTNETVDLEFNAPLTVPLRAVNGSGEPQPGLATWLRQVNRSDYYGGLTATDAEGRAVWSGLPPLTPFQFELQDPSREGPSRVRGQSEPITGQPGETLPEQVIVCEDKGGIEGSVVDAAGAPLPNRELEIAARDSDGRTRLLSPVTDEAGRFVVLWALPEARYPVVQLQADEGDGHLEAAVTGLEVVAGHTVNIGTVALQPVAAVPEVEAPAEKTLARARSGSR